MREVTKQEFFGPICTNRLDVHPHITSGFPYASIWKNPRSPLSPPYGKTVDILSGGVLIGRYFINNLGQP